MDKFRVYTYSEMKIHKIFRKSECYSGVAHEPSATRALLPGERLHLLRVQLLMYQSTLHFDGGEHTQGISAMNMLDISFFLFIITFFARDCIAAFRRNGNVKIILLWETARLFFSTLAGGEEGDWELKAESGGNGDSMMVFPAIMADAAIKAVGGGPCSLMWRQHCSLARDHVFLVLWG